MSSESILKKSAAQYLEELEGGQPTGSSSRCLVGQWIDSLPAELQPRYETLIQDKKAWPNAAALHGKLKQLGLLGQANILRMHRRNDCCCVSAGERGLS